MRPSVFYAGVLDVLRMPPRFMSPRIPTLAAVFALAALAFPNEASAQEYPACGTKPVTQKDSEAAHAKYLAGKVEYDEYHHAEAVRLFRDAYSRDCTKHELLIIISRSYALLGELPEAIRALETYLERVPGTPDATTYRNQIQAMKDTLAKRAQQAPAEKPSPAADKPAETAPPPAQVEERHHTVLPWVLVGVGAAAAGSGAVFLAVAPDLPALCDASTSRCDKVGTPSEIEERETTAAHSKDYPRLGAGLLIGGAVVLGGGLLWHFLEPTGPKPSASLVPAVGPGYGGVALGGRF